MTVSAGAEELQMGIAQGGFEHRIEMVGMAVPTQVMKNRHHIANHEICVIKYAVNESKEDFKP